MEKRVTLAFVVCIIFVFAYQWLIGRLYPTPPREAASAEVAEPAKPPTAQVPEPAAPKAAGLTVAEAQPPFVRETDRQLIEFSNVGAAITRIVVKDYFHKIGVQPGTPEARDPANWLTLWETGDTGKRLLSTTFDASEKIPEALDELPWQVVAQDPPTFRFQTSTGLTLEKKFELHPGEYYLTVSLSIAPRDQQGTCSLHLRSGAGLRKEGRAAYARGVSAVLGVKEGDASTLVTHDVRQLSQPITDQFDSGRNAIFAGLVNNYFGILLALDPADVGGVESSVAEAVVDESCVRAKLDALGEGAQRLGQRELDEMRNECRTTVFQDIKIALTRNKTHAFTLFAGPKESELMERGVYRTFHQWVQADYRMMPWINVGLLKLLRWLHGLVSNWGVAIILLTIIVRGTLFPINRYQSKSMAKFQKVMAKLKPELDELKQRHKNNPRKFQEAQMKLMREHNAKPPLMGCLVTLLPIPIFFGLFQVLGTAIELRHASFGLWVKDLSQPDSLPLPFSLPLIGNSLNVLPILMMITWFLQTMMTPKPTDPQAAQMQKMMSFMPFVMAAFLYNYAAGLSIYMVVSSLIAIVQIKFLNVTTPSPT
ncbi:MAG: YidC/Oxa1 family insertase periplasmic-domain containing protein [Planctomycetota bacterium]